MSNKQFKGIMPALITPFYEDGSVREDAVRKLIDYQLSMGAKGFYICGSTGEGPASSEATRMQMAKCVCEHIASKNLDPKPVVINHVGAPDALSAQRLAKHAQEVGCDAISSVPPTFYYNYSEDEIFEYYKALNDACDLPLLVYATGMFKQADVSPFIDRLMKLKNVIGLKFTRYNYYEMRKVIELNGGDINVINGPDEMLICGLTMGADAGIGSTYNVMTGQFVELYRRFTSGDFEGARQMQYKINHCVSVLIKHGVFPSIKAILNKQGFDVGYSAFPGKRYTPEQEAALMKDLDEIHFFEEYWGKTC